MKITWHGHSAFCIEAGGAKILIEPFLPDGWEGPAEGVTHILLTHGHDDHIGSTVDIHKKTGAMLVANPELAMFLGGQGVDSNKINPGNTGGTVDCGPFKTSFVQALHSSSSAGANGANTYLGNPFGLIIRFPNEKTVYHMGDTDIFGDMALINELYEPKIAMVPIGDRFTMGGAVAALACKRFFKFETIFPCHYGTFPILDQTADKLVEGMRASSAKVVTAKIGEAITV